MKTGQPYVSTGTVRSRFESGGETDDLDDILGGIALVADHEQFDPAIVWTARRLVDNESGLSDTERRRATLAVLALLIAVGEGCTRLPLDSPDYLDEILRRLASRCSQLAAEQDDARRRELLERTAGILRADRDADPADVLDTDVLGKLLGESNGEEAPYQPLILCDDGGALTSERLFRKEREEAKAFAQLADRRVAHPEESVLREAVESVKDHPTRYEADGGWRPQQLNFEQARAVVLTALKPLSLITGGPGTGKTTIVVSILRLLTRLGIAPSDIALAAPTGKAAYRMKESIDEQLASLTVDSTSIPEPDDRLRQNLDDARTLHRLLRYSPRSDRFWKNADDPLDARVVVCDEASMIDIDLMHALIEALPDEARLVLVGDADQLPAVSGGAVFRDLVGDPAPVGEDTARFVELLSDASPHDEPAGSLGAGLGTHTTELRYSYRMEGDDGGGEILELARQIRDCTSPDDPELTERLGDPMELDALESPIGVARIHPDAQRNDFVECWFDRFAAVLDDTDADPPAGATVDNPLHIDGGGFRPDSRDAVEELFDHYAKAQLLCVTQVFRTGARAINRAMHKLHTARLPGDPTGSFLPLEPVMVQRNDYDLDVFNGDQGLAVYLRDDETGKTNLYAVFPRSDGGFRPIAVSRLRERMTLAYATSIHKAQGSEFDHVAVVLPEKQLPLLTQQLLYTAVTRASRSVTVFDPEHLFETAAATPVRRFTGLNAALASNLQAPASRENDT